MGAPYLIEHKIDIEHIEKPLRVFEGTAREAAKGFPANLNVAVALSLAGIGAVLALELAAMDLSLVALIGIILLMGLVTKNSILLVDYTNTLSPAMLLNVRLSFARNRFLFDNQGLGFVPSSLGLPKALDAAVAALPENDPSPAPDLQLARLYLATDRPALALAQARRVLTRTRNADALFGLAETYRYMGNKADAVTAYERFLAVRPTGDDAAAEPCATRRRRHAGRGRGRTRVRRRRAPRGNQQRQGHRERRDRRAPRGNRHHDRLQR